MSDTPQLRGRPPKGPKSGKGNVLTTRITAETREALEAEAQRTGRSISQVAEIWLDEARAGQAGVHARLGGTQMAAAIEKLIEIEKSIREMVAPDLRPAALTTAWRWMLPLIVPREAVDWHDVEVAAQQRRCDDARRTMLEAIEAALERDPVRRRLHASSNEIAPGPSLLAEILEVDERRTWDITCQLKALLAAGETASDEICTALDEQAKLVKLVEVRRDRLREAVRIGEDIAMAHGARRPFSESE